MANLKMRYPAVALCALLAGCGGGGGGGASATAAAPAPVPAPPAAGSGGPINLQGANTTASYPAAVLYGAVMPSSEKATVTLTTDASGNLKVVSFNLPGFGLKDPGTSVSPTSSLSADIGNLAIIFRETIGFPNTMGYTLSQVAGAQTLSSSAFGLWGVGDQAGGGVGGFAFGNLTPAASVPVTGSASFNGTVIGVSIVNNGVLRGDAQIDANFANQSVTTKLTNLNTMNISTNVTGSLSDLTGTSAISGNGYSGAIAGGGLTGTITGNFYGSAAQETAGVWQASGGGVFWGGSYGAKK